MILIAEPEPEPREHKPGYLEWLRVRVAEFRKKWPRTHTADLKKLAKEKYRKR